MNTTTKKRIQYDCFVEVELEGTLGSNQNEISVSSVKYSLSKRTASQLSKDADDFELLMDALRKLPPSILNGSSNQEERNDMVQNYPESYTLNLNPGNIMTVDLQKLSTEQQLKALQDLINHVEQIHKAGFIISFFDLQNYVAYDKSRSQYVLIGFPYLIIDDDVIFRGINVVPDYKYAARSQLVFKGSSKQSDYLALLKNFLVYTHFKEYNAIWQQHFQQEDIKLITRENFFLNPSCQEMSLSYTIQDCNCEIQQFLYDRCPHQTKKIRLNLPEKMFKWLKNNCLDLIEYEYEKVNSEKVINSLNKEKKLKIHDYN